MMLVGDGVVGISDDATALGQRTTQVSKEARGGLKADVRIYIQEKQAHCVNIKTESKATRDPHTCGTPKNIVDGHLASNFD